MDGTNKILELLRQYLSSKELEDMFWDWCDRSGITRRGKIFALLVPITFIPFVLNVLYKSLYNTTILYYTKVNSKIQLYINVLYILSIHLLSLE